MKDIVVERILTAVAPDGVRSDITIRIGRPYRTDDADWACPVALDGFRSSPGAVHGTDSFQALMLAQRLAQQLLQAFVEDGGRIARKEDGVSINVTELFESGI